MHLVAFKIYAQSGGITPAGVPYYYPWMVDHPVDSDEALLLTQKGFKILTSEDYEAYILSISPSLKVQEVIENAIYYGGRLLVEFAAENVLLGITQAGKTSEVMDKLAFVNDAISTGSLYEAIYRIKAVPVEDYDSTFITIGRLVLFVNKIEAYLGLPESSPWN